MAARIRFKLSELSNEQLLELFKSVPSDEEDSCPSSDDEGGDFNVVEALTTALEYADTLSFFESENIQTIVQESEPQKQGIK